MVEESLAVWEHRKPQQEVSSQETKKLGEAAEQGGHCKMSNLLSSNSQSNEALKASWPCFCLTYFMSQQGCSPVTCA